MVDGLAASGGYITAMAGDHIVAQQTSLVGSIGVLFQFPNVTDLLKTIGVKVEEVKSSPLKAAPNGFEPTSPEARAALESIVKDSYAWFRGMVQDRRQIEGEALDHVADGRVFTGRQAVDLKLIDEIGDESDRECLARRATRTSAPAAGARFGAGSRFGDLVVPACRRPRARCRRPRGRWRAGSTTGARSRRSSGSTLTVCWRFGTLRPRIRPRRAEAYWSLGAAREQAGVA